MTIRQIPLSQITVPKDRLRKFRPDYMRDTLAPNMAERGQKHAIEVRQTGPDKYRLIAGLHRLEAAKLLKWETIKAELAADMGDAELNEHADTMAEIDENLVRAELSPIETREHVVERVRRVELTEARKRQIEADKVLASEAASQDEKRNARKTKKRVGAKVAKMAESAPEGAEAPKVGTIAPAPVGRFVGKGAELAKIGAALKVGKSTMSSIAREGNALAVLRSKYGVDTKRVIGTRLDAPRQLAALADALASENETTIQGIVRTIKAGDPVDVSRLLTRNRNDAIKESSNSRQHPEAVRARTLADAVYKAASLIRDKRIDNGGSVGSVSPEYWRELQLLKRIEDELFASCHRTKEFAKMRKADPVVQKS